jgi:2,3-dihydroxybiphenyl 1,2-dioxygenase
MLDAFGYASLRSDRLQDWADYGEKFLGLQLVDATRSTLSFRMDDRKQRILVQSATDAHHAFGWEVADAACLDALAARLEAAKVSVTRLGSPMLQLRAVRDAIRFEDPAGNVLEAFCGAEASPTPFTPGRRISGFRTGALGMGHVVLHVERADDLLWFYQDVLGFALSDYILTPFRAYFFHLNPRHHSLAMIETGKSGVHHMMLELLSLDDVGQAYDLASSVENRVATTLGRHTNDYMTSFYARSPDDFLIEYGWGGRAIDPKGWRPVEVTHGPSLWGHDRTWLPHDQLAQSRALRAKAAAEGLRQPVQVIAGNYELMAGACPWWDGVRGGAGGPTPPRAARRVGAPGDQPADQPADQEAR